MKAAVELPKITWRPSDVAETSSGLLFTCYVPLFSLSPSNEVSTCSTTCVVHRPNHELASWRDDKLTSNTITKITLSCYGYRLFVCELWQLRHKHTIHIHDDLICRSTSSGQFHTFWGRSTDRNTLDIDLFLCELQWPCYRSITPTFNYF